MQKATVIFSIYLTVLFSQWFCTSVSHFHSITYASPNLIVQRSHGLFPFNKAQKEKRSQRVDLAANLMSKYMAVQA